MLIISIMSVLTLSGVALNETEPNGEYTQAKRIYDDTNNYGYISSAGDVDWWVISFDTEGFANFYLGSLPKNYKMQIYKNNGSNLIAVSNDDAAFDENSKSNELFRIRVYQGINYYIKISGNSNSAYHSSDSYKLRCKVYALKPARVFTVDENNVLIDDGLDPIYTRDVAQNIIPSLWSMGYTAIEYENNSANAATTVYSTSDIIVTASHGYSGIMIFNSSRLFANQIGSTTNSADKSLYSDAGDASELDLVIYGTCFSGCDSNFGNLVDVTLEKGAYACFGWENTIYTTPMAIWFDKLFEELATGKTVAEAISCAHDHITEYENGEDFIDGIRNIYDGSSRLDKLILGGY